MGMGRYVNIVGSTGPPRVICVHELGKETVYATVEKPYRNTFDPDERDTPKEWCPFLQKGEHEGTFVCIIHATRPKFCRDFVCATMRIYTQDGVESGRVKGHFNLVSSDDRLNALWNERIKPLIARNDVDWKAQAAEIIESEGYRLEVYE